MHPAVDELIAVGQSSQALRRYRHPQRRPAVEHRHAAYRISGHTVSVFRIGSKLVMLPRQRKILLCRLLVHACKIFAMRHQTFIFPSPAAYTVGTWRCPGPALFVRPCQLVMPFHCLPVHTRLLLISCGDLLMIRASARRFDFLFKAGRLVRPFGRATAQYQDRCGQNRPPLIHVHRLFQSLLCEFIDVPTIRT